MKNLLLAISFSGAALLSACATAATPVVLAPVGPDHSSAVARSSSGGLRVYSGYDPNTSALDEMKPFQNASYEIRTESGSLVETMPNTYGTRAGEKPPVVELAAGSYRIVAWSPRQGLVTVPVKIVGGQMTTVHLDSGKS